jgi:protein-S-isoprenylcysteine O-methyltransferase Ste14
MTSEPEDRPNVGIHPPTVFFSALIIGFAIRVFAGGWLPLPRVFAEGVGGLTMIAALSIVITSISAFAEAGETLRPATPSHQLFTKGIYRRSRNPIYLAMVLFGAGFGIATLNLWIVLTSILTGVVLNFLVIPHEEEYLARRFGVDYEDYRLQVRRWL